MLIILHWGRSIFHPKICKANNFYCYYLRHNELPNIWEALHVFHWERNWQWDQVFLWCSPSLPEQIGDKLFVHSLLPNQHLTHLSQARSTTHCLVFTGVSLLVLSLSFCMISSPLFIGTHRLIKQYPAVCICTYTPVKKLNASVIYKIIYMHQLSTKRLNFC